MKHASSLLLAAALAAAQSTTVVDVLMPQAGPPRFAGSVVSAGPTATAYVINCAAGGDPTECGLPGDLTVTNGPSIVEFTATAPGSQWTAYGRCTFDLSKDIGVCTGGQVSDSTTSSTDATLNGWSTLFVPVTITAGAEKLSGTAATTANSTAATGAPATTLSTSSSGGSGLTTAPTTSTSTSTGGMPRITQNAVVLGAAALVGGAMLV